MTDYNDGKWHLWNGGQCPVNVRSKIDAVWQYKDGNAVLREGERAGSIVFLGNAHGSVVAFRVTEPYEEPRQPRTFWVNEHPMPFAKEGRVFSLHRSQQDAHISAATDRIRCFRVVEVTEK